MVVGQTDGLGTKPWRVPPRADGWRAWRSICPGCLAGRGRVDGRDSFLRRAAGRAGPLGPPCPMFASAPVGRPLRLTLRFAPGLLSSPRFRAPSAGTAVRPALRHRASYGVGDESLAASATLNSLSWLRLGTPSARAAESESPSCRTKTILISKWQAVDKRIPKS